MDANGVAQPDVPDREAPRTDAFQPWHFFLLASLLAATVAVVITRQSRPEHLVLISLIIGAAGLAAAALFRTLLPLVREDTRGDVEPPLSGTLRAVLEREKLLVLRTIKELEFDRAMGKVSAKDFDEMAGRLRARAMSIMRQLDGGAGYRELIERELSARLRAAAAPRPAVGEAAVSAGGTAESGQRISAGDLRICACGTSNDEDAAYCKRCGTKIVPSVEP